MKYLTLDLQRGIVRTINNYTTNHFDKRGCQRAYERPTDEFYLVVCPVQNMVWYRIDEWQRKNTKFDENILNDVRNKKAGLILSGDSDTFTTIPKYGRKGHEQNIINYIIKTSNRLGVSTDRVIYIDSNYITEKFLNRFNLKGLWFNWPEIFYEPTDTSIIKESIILKKPRQKKFLHLGGRARDYRLQFANELLKLPNFRNDSFFSVSKGSFIDFFTKENKFMETILLDDVQIENLQEDEANLIPLEFFGESYVNIVPMSNFYLNYSQIEMNEKLFKPIITMLPFIVLGEPNTLNVLHELGYKTFDKWIDESYDTTLDDRERFIKVLEEVKKLNQLSKEQLNDMLLDMLPVLEHNLNLRNERFYDKTPILLNKIKKAFDLY